MREIAPLYAVLVVLLLVESLVWVKSGRQLVFRWRRGRDRLVDGADLVGNQRGGFALLVPWLWRGEAFLCGGDDAEVSADVARGPQSLREELTRARIVLGPLRVACAIEWLVLFGGFPALVAWFGLAACWPALLAMLAIAQILTLALAWRAHRILYPQARAARWGLAARLAASPPAAVRAADALSLPLFQQEHAIAVALAVGAQHAVIDPARRALVDARQRSVEPPLRRLFEAWDLDVDALLRPPTREHDGCVAYCPRCLTQYIEPVTSCVNCPTVVPLSL